jgi:phage terminase small subunit
MSQQITIQVSDRVARQAEQVAADTRRRVEEVLSSWLESVADDSWRKVSTVTDDLVALVEEEKGSDQPITAHTFCKALNLLRTTYKELGGAVPAPAIAPDGDGGIVMEWFHGSDSVKAIVSRESTKRSYIYYKADSESAIEDLSGEELASRIRSIILKS